MGSCCLSHLMLSCPSEQPLWSLPSSGRAGKELCGEDTGGRPEATAQSSAHPWGGGVSCLGDSLLPRPPTKSQINWVPPPQNNVSAGSAKNKQTPPTTCLSLRANYFPRICISVTPPAVWVPLCVRSHPAGYGRLCYPFAPGPHLLSTQ